MRDLTYTAVHDGAKVFVKERSCDGTLANEYCALNLAYGKIPVPRPIKYYEENGRSYLVTEYIEGETLQSLWTLLSPDDKALYADKVRKYLGVMANIKSDRIESASGGQLNDLRIFRKVGNVEVGPFDAVGEYTREYSRVLTNGAIVVDTEYRCDFVLNHNDLEPRNIIVTEDKEVAIVDWECAGYYPRFYELAIRKWDLRYKWRNSEWNKMLTSEDIPKEIDIIAKAFCMMNGDLAKRCFNVKHKQSTYETGSRLLLLYFHLQV